MQKYFRPKKVCNCLFPSNKEILKKEVNNSFCKRCGSMILRSSELTINYTIKPKLKQAPNQINPIDIIRTMKKNTDINYPYLNNVERTFETLDTYLSNRKMILVHLQKLMKIFDYNDIVFYQCLFFMDYVFSRQITEELTEKDIIYHLVGYFLCATKMKEKDMIEPPLEFFVKVKQNTFLSIKQIAYYEVLCLKSINYNILSYSAYDWIIQLIAFGIVFDCEIDNNKSIILINGHRHTIINTINKCALKILLNLTLKNVFIKFSPMHIAFSIIQIAREKYLEPNLINHNLYNKLINLYGIDFTDYQQCYEEIKLEINQNTTEKEKDKQEKKDNNINNQNNKLKSKIIKQHSIGNNTLSNIYQLKKNIAMNKSSSCKNLLDLEEKSNPKEISSKINHNTIDIPNQIKEKSSLENEKKSDGKYGKGQNRDYLKKIVPKKYSRLSISSKKISGRSNDSLPLINTTIKKNVEQLKENIETGVVIKSSKSLVDIFESSTSKFTNSKIIFSNKNLSNLSNSTTNKNKIDNILYKLSSIPKKSLFQNKINNSIQNNSKEKKLFYRLGKSSKVVTLYNNNEDMKINKNVEIFDKLNEQNHLRARGHLRNKPRRSLFSLPNKRNQSVDAFPENYSKVHLN